MIPASSGSITWWRETYRALSRHCARARATHYSVVVFTSHSYYTESVIKAGRRCAKSPHAHSERAQTERRKRWTDGRARGSEERNGKGRACVGIGVVS